MQTAVQPIFDALNDAAAPGRGASTRLVSQDDELCRRIYRHFVDAIKNGSLAAGAKVPAERQLAVHFAASRTIVRKALQILLEDGLIEKRVGSGTFVRQGLATASQLQDNQMPDVSPLDILEARLAIEPGMADLVVARATDADFKRIDAALEHMRGMAETGTQQEFKESGYLVHMEIVRASRNPLLIWIYGLLIEARIKAGWDTLRQLNDAPELRQEQLKSVSDNVAALRMRDTKKASDLSRQGKLRLIQQVIGLDWSSE
ncbi:FadR family transcriptional regulator [Ochrobactrum sp. C6C9]|uniref:FadR/GntR family transcriptional regulator n=1 Tax=Ochrobactrum sp. C6C9 TaxID=2736662 RepID=UPI003530258D|nr:FadR family transcriptional regulator [Ochrobactrum sp. C6C9]